MNDPRIDAWLATCTDPANDPLQGMAEAGLLAPVASYTELARVKADLVERTGVIGISSVWGGHQMVGRYWIEGCGTPAQRSAWLGRICSVAISEPKVGAHPKLLTTRADAVDGFYRITGEKAWVTNGPIADAIIVVAITQEDAGRKRYSGFIVPRDTPGLSMKEMPGFHALRPSRHCQLTLDGCVVPADAVLGPLHHAYERMALPFRDQEDAVGTFGTLGAFRFLLRTLRGAEGEEAALSLGALIALTAVFSAAAESVVAELDVARLRPGSPTLVGLRVLAAEMLTRFRTHIAAHGPTDNQAVATMLADIEAGLNVARGPRLARQARLAVS